MSRRTPFQMIRPAAPTTPVILPDGTQHVIPSDPFEDATLSEVMVRVARAYAKLYYHRPRVPINWHPADLYTQVTTDLTQAGFRTLSIWTAAIACNARLGTSPASYSREVIRRARQHRTNALHGNPWRRTR